LAPNATLLERTPALEMAKNSGAVTRIVAKDGRQPCRARPMNHCGPPEYIHLGQNFNFHFPIGILEIMVDFITVTRQDNDAHEVVNVDAIDTMVVVEAVELPPLESGDDTVTAVHVGYCRLTLRSGRVLNIAETGEDFQALVKSPNGGLDATKKLGEKRQERYRKLASDRAKARLDLQAKKMEAEHKADLDRHEKEVAAVKKEEAAAKKE
jgi:hypothetical protein